MDEMLSHALVDFVLVGFIGFKKLKKRVRHQPMGSHLPHDCLCKHEWQSIICFSVTMHGILESGSAGSTGSRGSVEQEWRPEGGSGGWLSGRPTRHQIGRVKSTTTTECMESI